MLRRRFALLIVLLLSVAALNAAAQTVSKNVFFLHHSVGRYMLEDADLRGWFADFDADHGTQIRFWDHDYNYIGLRNPPGVLLGYHYGAAAADTDPDGLHYLWTTNVQPAARDSILSKHDVIVFKSCYTGSDVISDARLAQWQQYYLGMLPTFAEHPDKTFILLTSPPRNRRHAMGEASIAARARALATWLTGPQMAGSLSNLHVFDLFDVLAEPNDGQPGANTLRSEYERNSSTDSHPNTLANTVFGPLVAQFVVERGGLTGVTSSAVDTPAAPVLRSFPNPFNPITSLAFNLDRAQPVDLQVYDLRGRLVSELIAGDILPAGPHARTWNGRDRHGNQAPAGLYLCRLRTDASTSTIKVSLVE